MRRSHASEEGASLILVLCLLASVSVVGTALLGYAGVSFTAEGDLRRVRQEDYAADGALTLAIKRVQATASLGRAGTTNCGLTLQAMNGVSTTVTCTPAGSSGSPQGSHPQYALLTLSPTKGIAVTGNFQLTVGGDVYSHATILADHNKSRLLSSGNVTAEKDGDCSGFNNKNEPYVQADLVKLCSSPTPAGGADPAWASRAGNLFASVPSGLLNQRPSCTSVGLNKSTFMMATFAQGKYTLTPNSLVTATAGCSHVAVLYFPPGVYYFEDVPFDTGDYSVVSGTAGDWLESGVLPSDGAACATDEPGSQFILGGTSTFTVANMSTTIALCAGPPEASPSIAIYGTRTTQGGLKQETAPTAISTADKPNFFVHGTIYTPTTAISITLHNTTQTHLDRGIVALSFTGLLSASTKQLDSPISLAACSTSDPCVGNRQAVFVASVGGQQLEKAAVDFDDAGGGQPGRAANLKAWTVLR